MPEALAPASLAPVALVLRGYYSVETVVVCWDDSAAKTVAVYLGDSVVRKAATVSV